MFAVPPHLDVYYASSCAPCRVELPVLRQAARENKDIRILIVSDPRQAAIDLAAAGPGLARAARLADGKSPRDRLRRAGDADGILPFTRSVGARGQTCASWRGILTLARIQDLLSRCR